MEKWKEQLYEDELYHYGVLGMKWGVRRYQNKEGGLTMYGKHRINSSIRRLGRTDRYERRAKKNDEESNRWVHKHETTHNKNAVKSTNYSMKAAKYKLKALRAEGKENYSKAAKYTTKAAKSEVKSRKYKLKSEVLLMKADEYKQVANETRQRLAKNYMYIKATKNSLSSLKKSANIGKKYIDRIKTISKLKPKTIDSYIGDYR